MPFRFQKRVRLAKGLTLNVGKKGVTSLRIGKRGAGVSLSKKGGRTTVGVPGTGTSYSKTSAAGCVLPLLLVLSSLLVLLR